MGLIYVYGAIETILVIPSMTFVTVSSVCGANKVPSTEKHLQFLQKILDFFDNKDVKP